MNSTRIQVGDHVFYSPLAIEGDVVFLNRETNRATVQTVTEDGVVEMTTLPISQLTVVKGEEKVNPLEIKVKYHDEDIDKIEKISKGDWIDLRAAETVDMNEGEFKLISLGLGMKLPEGYEAHIAPRSSTFKNFGILQTNSVGVVDNSYSGNEDIWKFPAYAVRRTVIHKNERICQFRITEKMPEVKFTEVDQLDAESRGGFGSTGTK